MDKRITNLIKFIICYAADREINLTTIRLVKFIYLADLFHARYNAGKTLTGLPWAFVYYGPYCSEVMRHIDEAVFAGAIEQEQKEGNFSKDYFLFHCPDGKTEVSERDLPLAVTSKLKWAIEKFGDNTAALLDFVYFDTEPMMNAKQGKLLDFTKAQKFEPDSVDLKTLSAEKIALGKEYGRRLVERFKYAQENLIKESAAEKKWKDEIYFRALDSFEEGDLPEGLSGIAHIGE